MLEKGFFGEYKEKNSNRTLLAFGFVLLAPVIS